MNTPDFRKRNLAWATGLAAGVAALAAGAGWIALRSRPGLSGRWTLDRLHAAVLNQPMTTVLQRLGPPRTTATPPPAPHGAVPEVPSTRQATSTGVSDGFSPDSAMLSSVDEETWYYPFDPARRIVIAIRFVAGIARAVESVEPLD